MLTHLRPAIVLTLLFIVLTGLAYPLAITGIGQLAFPAQANGSLIRNGETVVGSSLIGQNFASDRYFWPRPSVDGRCALQCRRFDRLEPRPDIGQARRNA